MWTDGKKDGMGTNLNLIDAGFNGEAHHVT